MKKFIVGLTGGIGSGKSYIEKKFTKFDGVKIIDADVISRQLQEPGNTGYIFLKHWFGDSKYAIFDLAGNIDRARFREIVFSDIKVKETVETMMSPLIYNEIVRLIGEYSADDSVKYIILTVPMLIEKRSAPFAKLVDRILVVDCPESLQSKRVEKRNGIDPSVIEKIMLAQSPRWARIVKADDIIENFDKEDSELESLVHEMHVKYIEIAANSRN